MAGHETTIGRIDDNLDYRRASAAERMRSIFSGDEVGLYFGSPAIQRQILAEEAEAAAREAEAGGIPGAIGTLTVAEAFPPDYVPQAQRLAA